MRFVYAFVFIAQESLLPINREPLDSTRLKANTPMLKMLLQGFWTKALQDNSNTFEYPTAMRAKMQLHLEQTVWHRIGSEHY